MDWNLNTTLHSVMGHPVYTDSGGLKCLLFLEIVITTTCTISTQIQLQS